MEEKKCRITFSKVTALLCALAALFGLIAFFGGDLTAKTEYLNEQIKHKETQITQIEDHITQLQADITGYQQEKQNKNAELTAAKEDVEKANQDLTAKQVALQRAENELDTVCVRSYYSSWNCSSECQALHTAVSTRKTELNDAQKALEACKKTVKNIENDIERIANKITQAEKDIQTEQSRIAYLNDEIKELKAELAGARFIVTFKVLAMLLALGGLGLLAKNFYTETKDDFTFYAVVGLAASSLLFFIAGAINNPMAENAPVGYLLLSPHTWNMAVMGLFIAVLKEKTEKPVLLRNIAVVLVVILGVLAVAGGAPFIGVLYAAAMICTAFVIVPLVFTEYIDIAKHIFLSIITFGIWQLVWTYHVTKNLNNVEAVEDRRPARELLLCMFLFLYYPYWLYKTAEGVENYGKEKAKEFKIDVLCIAFSFVCPLFATVLIQNKINVVVGKPVCAEPEASEICE